ncbi:hypothetical protein [Nocardia sp. bgisy118]|uniref:hypothetical protein n=1 Tax=Nocardia sp. bgisy118 TaxID=3413786 RepID=UPI003F4A44B3
MTPGEWLVSDDIDDQTTFLAHAISLAALHGPGPWPAEGRPLPDDSPDERKLLNSTVLDGVQTHHATAPAEPDVAAAAVATITDIVAAPSDSALAALHDQLAERSALALADALVRELRAATLPRDEVRSVARWLTEHGTRRNAVALGIVILGVTGDERDRELLLTLGTLGDLTLYAVVALGNSQPDRHRAVYQLARRVDGWGRIHAVERLARTTDPEIKAWLLRTGFRNGVMNEYLAHLAATTGDLRGALLASEVGDELLDGAADILAALALHGGPAADIRHYPDALPVLIRFAELLATAAPTLTRIRSTRTITGLLNDPPPELDWPSDEVTGLATEYAALLARTDWADEVRARLAQPEGEFGFNQALSCAEAVGIQAYPQALAHLRRNPRNGYAWQWVSKRTPDHAVAALADLAQDLLPLDEITRGPKPGGRRRADDHILEIMVSTVRRAASGTGLPLVRSALGANPVRLRRAALRTLVEWYGHDLPDDIRSWVTATAATEPDDELRRELTALIDH